MPIVSDFLRDLVERQINDSKLVVWFDPEQHYTEFVQKLTLPQTTIVRYDGSFFALRHQIDHLLNDDEPPRLLVYVPLAEETTHNALVELTAAGVDLKPGHHSLPRNTRLSVVAKRALRDTQGAEKVEDLARQVEAGKLTLADLDEVESIVGESAVVLAIFGTGHPQDVALQFLSSDRHDADIVARNATAELAMMLGNSFGIALPDDAPCSELRQRLARHVLATEFISSLHDVPQSLSTVNVATTTVSRTAAVELVREWRLRRDLSDSYAEHANQTEAALGLANITFEVSAIRDCETFERIEWALQEGVEVALFEQPETQMIELARSRQSSYWAERMPELQARWALIMHAGILLYEAGRIESELKKTPTIPGVLLQHYVSGDQPWCLIDTHHRNLERRWNTFDLMPGTAQATLERLVNRAKQRYMDVGGALAEAFVRALADNKFDVPGVRRQTEVYAQYVKPAINEGKTAYVLVDALRYEMARELRASFADGYDVQLDVVLGVVPAITEIGMAALMPGADRAAEVVSIGSGKLGLKIGDVTLKDRTSRIDWFTKQQRKSVAVATLEDVLTKGKRQLHQQLRAADIILVTSQEIDQIAESGNNLQARREMDTMLRELGRLINHLRDWDFRTIVIAADHGHLFGDDLDTDMKIDAPGGEGTKDLHRRAWVGIGGSADESFLRVPLSLFGLSKQLDIAVPWGFGAFKVAGGARAYFHGGMSPQELAIPVMVLKPTQARQTAPSATTEWKLTPGSNKISTRFFSVQISGRAVGLLELEAPRVRVEIRAQDAVLSQSVAASYGFVEATGEIELRVMSDDPQAIEPNSVTLMLTSETDARTVSVHLLDAITGRELCALPEVEVAISL